MALSSRLGFSGGTQSFSLARQELWSNKGGGGRERAKDRRTDGQTQRSEMRQEFPGSETVKEKGGPGVALSRRAAVALLGVLPRRARLSGLGAAASLWGLPGACGGGMIQ